MCSSLNRRQLSAWLLSSGINSARCSLLNKVPSRSQITNMIFSDELAAVAALVSLFITKHSEFTFEGVVLLAQLTSRQSRFVFSHYFSVNIFHFCNNFITN